VIGAVDDAGRVAIMSNNKVVVVWSGDGAPVEFTRDAESVFPNPVGLVAVTTDRSIVVFDHAGATRSYHAGSGFAPSVALLRPLATLPETDGTVSVVDLRDGTLRHYPLPVVAAEIDVDGERVFATTGALGLVWPIPLAPPAAVLEASLARATNATTSPDSTRLDYSH
jgi:hypothetical protein